MVPDGNPSGQGRAVGNVAPIINDYKLSFFTRRWMSTLLGGARCQVPCTTHLLQSCLFLIPPFVPIIATLLFDSGMVNSKLYAAIGAGVAVFFVSLIISFGANACRSAVPSSNFDDDEQDMDFDDLSCGDVCHIVMPAPVQVESNVQSTSSRPSHILLYLTRSALAAVVAACFVHFLQLDSVRQACPSSIALYLYLICSWTACAIMLYGITIRTPVEPNVFDASASAVLIGPFSRALYIFIAEATWFAYTCVFDNADIASVLWSAVIACRVLVAILPLLWPFGALPAVDSLTFWLLEQLTIVFGGGTASASHPRIVASFISSFLAAALIAFIIGFTNSPVLLVGVALPLARLLSSDVLLPSLHFSQQSDRVSIVELGSAEQQDSDESSWRAACCPFPQLHSLGTVLLCGAWLGAGIYFGCINSQPLLLSSNLSSFVDSIIVVASVAGVWLLNVLSIALSRPAIPFSAGLIRSPCIRPCLVSGRRILSIVSPFLQYLAQLACLLALLIHGKWPASGISQILAFIFGVTSMRAFRALAQSSQEFLLDSVIVLVTRYVSNSMSAPNWFTTLDYCTQLLLIAFIRTRLLDCIDKLYYMLVHSITIWTEPKLGVRRPGVMALAQVLMLPVHVAVLLASVALSTPVLPLLGTPIFILAFPRPQRIWPVELQSTNQTAPSKNSSNNNNSTDALFYEQLTPSLLSKLPSLIQSGGLGSTLVPSVLPGQYYLLRFEKFLMWFAVHEVGPRYCCVSLKGLELQGTSCHTVEASSVDSIFDSALQPDAVAASAASCSVPMSSLFHTLTPLSTINVNGYSLSTTALSGIIDSPTNLSLVSRLFLQSLTVRLHAAMGSSFGDQPMIGQRIPIEARSGWTDGEQLEKWADLKQPLELFPVHTHARMLNVSEADARVHLGNSSSPRHPLVDIALRCFLAVHELSHTSSSSSVTVAVVSIASAPAPSLYDSLFGSNQLPSQHVSIADRWSSSNVEMTVQPVKAAPVAVSRVTAAMDLDLDDDDDSVALPNRVSAKPAVSIPMKKAPVKDDFDDELEELMKFGQPSPKPVAPPVQSVAVSQAQFAPASNITVPATALSQPVIVQSISRPITINTTSSATVVPLTSAHATRVYHGKLATHQAAEWLKQHENLLEIVIQSWREAVRMMYDAVAMAETDELGVDSAETTDQVLNSLSELSTWYLGPENGDWNEHLLRETPSLFNIRPCGIDGVYFAHTATLGTRTLQVASLNAASVNGIWTSLSLEMLYFANDDDERYSIQAHPLLLRNMTVQAADPPLGYPLFVKAPTIVRW